MRKFAILGCLVALVGCSQNQVPQKPLSDAELYQQQQQQAALLRLSQSLLNSGAPSSVPVNTGAALSNAANSYYGATPQTNPYAVDTRVQVPSAPPAPVNCATSYSQIQHTYYTHCN